MPRIFYISDVTPRQGTGGSIIACRHLEALVNDGRQVVVIAPSGSPSAPPACAQSTFVMPARKPWWPPFRHNPSWLASLRCRFWEYELERAGLVPRDGDVIVTICWSSFSWFAATLARRHKVPLVTIVHDLWTESASASFNAIGRYTVRHSSLILAVSDDMRSAFSDTTHVAVQTLLPVPATSSRPPAVWQPRFASQPCIAHLGTLHTYHVPYLVAIGLRLESFGGRLLLICPDDSPHLPELKAALPALLHHETFPRNEDALDYVATHASAVTVMYPVLAPETKPRTGFPSRLLELSQLGLPILIAAPEGNPVRNWARGAAWTAQSSPGDSSGLDRFISAIREQSTWDKLAAETRKAAAEDFSPTRIHHQFLNAVLNLGSTASPNCETAPSTSRSV